MASSAVQDPATLFCSISPEAAVQIARFMHFSNICGSLLCFFPRLVFSQAAETHNKPGQSKSWDSAGIFICIFPCSLHSMQCLAGNQEHGISQGKNPKVKTLLDIPAMPLWMLWMCSRSCSPLWYMSLVCCSTRTASL